MTEAELIAKKLSRYRGKLLPLPIFLEIYKLFVAAVVEIAPFYKDKVLLVKRPADDPVWPNLYHLPGTVVRQTDKLDGFSDAFKRILRDELKNVKTSGRPILIAPFFRDLGRGKEMTLLYRVSIKERPGVGRLFNINRLPKNIIRQQIKYIKMAYRCIKH